MSFTFDSLFETEEQERERLAQYPPASKNGFLATLPVTAPYIKEGMLIELPKEPGDPRIVVAVWDFRGTPYQSRKRGGPVRRDDPWLCLVVASTSETYQVGGYRIIVQEDELRRGRQITSDKLLNIS